MEKSQSNHGLNQLNKASHKISKPTTIITRRIPQPPLKHLQEEEIQSQNNQSSSQQNQPPVYNINKSDFRQVVQKLTGSPAHTPSPPSLPPIHSSLKPQSSRLQRIRPPPLAHLTTTAIRPSQQAQSTQNPSFFSNNGRSMAPLSPLPPFPSVHAAAESPISAYMKYIRGSNSPKWLNPNMLPPPPLVQQQQFGLPSPNSLMGSSQFGMPNSPIAFGKIQSPRSPYPLLSPSSLFSPTSGQLRFPQFHF
ncbi:hypothetical protein ACHQM5_023492 [Ranunculus cassubicifolius]